MFELEILVHWNSLQEKSVVQIAQELTAGHQHHAPSGIGVFLLKAAFNLESIGQCPAYSARNLVDQLIFNANKRGGRCIDNPSY